MGVRADPVEVVAQNAFDNQVVSGCGRAPTGANVDLPLGGKEQIEHGEDLVLLIVHIHKVAELAPVSVVFNTEVELFGGLVG